MQTRIKQYGKEHFEIEYFDGRLEPSDNSLQPNIKGTWKYHRCAVTLERAKAYQNDLQTYGIDGVVIE
jgi:hypothetical protein